jgi:hypothetical protein
MSEFDHSELDSKVYQCIRSLTGIAIKEGHAINAFFTVAKITETLKFYTETIVTESLLRLEKGWRIRKTDSMGSRWDLI